MKKIILTLVAASLVLSMLSCGAKKGSTVEGTLEPQYIIQDEIVTVYQADSGPSYPGDIDRADFEPLTRIYVLSDIRFKADRLNNAMETYKASGSDSAFNDAIIFLGNLTDGKDIESLSRVKDYIDNSLPDEPIALPIPSKGDITIADGNFDDKLGYPVRRNITSNNTHILTLGCDADGSYSSNIDWLKTELTRAEEEKDECAIIVATAAPLTDEVKAILSEHPAVVSIVLGETEDGSVISRDSYTTFTVSNPELLYSVEFDSYSRMLIRCLDFNGNVMKNDDGTDMEYFIQTPWLSDAE